MPSSALFADSFYWVALFNDRDPWHAVVTNTSAALAGRRLVTTDEVLAEVLAWFASGGPAARAYCASDWQIFKTVVIPGAVPFILTGVRQAVALGLIGVVVGEMFGGSEGIGYMVNYGGQTFQTDTVFLGVTIIALSGIILTWLAERLERRFSRWRPER